MERKSIIRLLTVIFCLCFSIPLFAETIVLKSGKTIEAKIIKKTDNSIKVDIEGVSVTYYLGDIESINGKTVANLKDSDIPKITYEDIAKSVEKEAQESLKSSPQSAKSYIERGIAFRMNGNQKEAINYFTKAIEIDPDSAEAYHNRGLSYAGSKMNRPDLAMADFSKAIEKNPHDGDNYFMRASLYFDQREYDKAWEDINKVKALGLKYYAESFPQFLEELKKASGREK